VLWPALSVALALATLPASAQAPDAAATGAAARDAATVAPAVVPADPAPRPWYAGIWSFKLENDLFGGTDQFYTAGWQFSWGSPDYDPPRVIRWLTDLGLKLLPDGTPRWGLAFGQQIYTPADTLLVPPDPSDRPYAGYLYGAMTVSSYNARDYGALELQLGVVGPSALGEQVQNNLHDFLNIDRAYGWDYQLKDEPAFNLGYTRLWRYNYRFNRADPDSLQYGIVPGVTAAIGNVDIYGSAGFMVRFGRNLDADFGPPRIRPSLAGSGYFDPRGQGGWYVFGGVEGRLVAHDIFLDGNTWRNGPSVDKKNAVADFTLGAAYILPWGRLTYTHVIRTTEFNGQGDTFQFGSISLSARF